MTHRPLVSVGLAFWNNQSTIGLAIASVLSQTFEDLELIVIDDGSTDGGGEVVRHFDDKRIRLVDDGDNRGIVPRLNQLTELATGHYLARMDGDDVCDPRRLERQVERLSADDDLDVVATGAWVIDEGNRVVGTRHRQPLPQAPGAVLGHGYLLQPSVLARRSWFADHPYDPRYIRAEDKELWCRTWRHGRFTRLTDPLLFYREASYLRPAAYRAGCRSDRAIYRRYGPTMAGPARTAALLARSVLVEAATLSAHALGAEERLIRRRTDPADRQALEQGQATLDSVSSNSPTLDPGRTGRS